MWNSKNDSPEATANCSVCGCQRCNSKRYKTSRVDDKKHREENESSLEIYLRLELYIYKWEGKSVQYESGWDGQL